MSEQVFFNVLLVSWFVLAVIVFVTLFFVVAPYGRHLRSSWGPTVGNKTGWVTMESVAPLVFAVCFALGTNANTVTMLVFLGLWEVHYIHRAFIYPFGLRGLDKRMPIAVMSLAILFNAGNGYLNGRYLFSFSGGYANQWLGDPRFIAGLALFLIGFFINRQADYILLSLRKQGESGYRIAHAGLYRWISCPNYLGEIIIWMGWAVATWSLPGLAFALWTSANLAPRAKAHHTWYQKYFPDYPPERKVLVPRLW